MAMGSWHGMGTLHTYNLSMHQPRIAAEDGMHATEEAC